MKYALLVSRYGLGLAFFVLGLNGFLEFLPAPEFGVKGGAFIKLLQGSGYWYVVKALEVAAGVSFLSGMKIPVGLSLLGPVLANILLFHIFFSVETIVLPLILLVFFAILFWDNYKTFKPIFEA